MFESPPPTRDQQVEQDRTPLVLPISQNWRGKPLVSHEVVVNLIGATTTRTGLRVQSQLDTNRYPAGRTVSDDELEAIYLRRDSFQMNGIIRVPRVALLN